MYIFQYSPFAIYPSQNSGYNESVSGNIRTGGYSGLQCEVCQFPIVQLLEIAYTMFKFQHL